ncbi:MAG: ELM1/GtrOC1 family putative glycosyltransferase [Alphaproteobacteria bacterium]
MSDADLSSLTCWCVSANNAGMINQALGLAEAIGIRHETKLVRQGVWWRFLPPRFWPHALDMKEGGGRFEGPWPDVVISCGQRSVATALAIRRASGNRTLLIHVQNPNAPLSRFAFVVAPRHDGLKGPNVLETLGAVHRVSAARLAEAAKTPDPRFAGLRRPILAVLVGGSTMRGQVTDATMQQFVAALKRAGDAGARPRRHPPRAAPRRSMCACCANPSPAPSSGTAAARTPTSIYLRSLGCDPRHRRVGLDGLRGLRHRQAGLCL